MHNGCEYYKLLGLDMYKYICIFKISFCTLKVTWQRKHLSTLLKMSFIGTYFFR